MPQVAQRLRAKHCRSTSEETGTKGDKMTDSKAEETKMCPIISARQGRPWLRRNCLQKECAWWVESGDRDREDGSSGQCAVRSLAEGFRLRQ